MRTLSLLCLLALAAGCDNRLTPELEPSARPVQRIEAPPVAPIDTRPPAELITALPPEVLDDAVIVGTLRDGETRDTGPIVSSEVELTDEVPPPPPDDTRQP